MREHLDERILHGFVGIVGVAQIVIRDPHRTALLAGDEFGEALAGDLAVPCDDQCLDGAGQLRVPRQYVPGRGLSGRVSGCHFCPDGRRWGSGGCRRAPRGRSHWKNTAGR
jgi:hypothetical protein